jgi:3',5'-cyclic AMP phosphodiesterase CpdA
VIGDFGVGRERERALGAAVRAQHPDALVSVGDNNYARPHSFAANWHESFGWATTVVAALGNHDVEHGDGTYEFGILSMPGRFFSKRVGEAELIVLDSNAVDAKQTAFLRRRLATSPAAWKIPVFHHPPYLCGAERPSLAVRKQWLPLFRQFGVRLVLNGHDHDYERFVDGGTMYVVDGGGAADLYPLRPCKPGTPDLVASNQHEHTFLMLTVSAGQIDAEVRSVSSSRVVDRFTVLP